MDLELSGIGHLAASLLIAMILGETVEPGVRAVASRLIARESTEVMPELHRAAVGAASVDRG